MSAVLQTHKGAAGDVNSRLNFQKNLQAVTNKIHATLPDGHPAGKEQFRAFHKPDISPRWGCSRLLSRTRAAVGSRP